MTSLGPCKRLATGLVFGLLAAATPAHAQQLTPVVRTNAFNDPFQQASNAISNCPEPEGPLVTPEEMRAQSHIRAEKGTTCHYYGRCRLPSAYLYDREIVPRVARFISLDPRFSDSSIWILGQRRWVYLKGCVRDAPQALALEREVRLIDDVEAVVNELMVGTDGKPPYAVAH